jgi:phage terminase large subunit
VGVDAAHMGNDESVIACRRGLLTLPLKTLSKADGLTLAGTTEEQCQTLVDAGGTIGMIVIELDGPGVSAYDQLKRGKFASVVVGVHTGAALSDDRNFNVKARMWRLALEYLKVGGCSMPTDPELKSQLSSYRYGYKNGVLLMESKKEYKKRIGKSPDRADAWILTHTPMKKEAPPAVVPIPMVNHYGRR